MKKSSMMKAQQSLKTIVSASIVTLFIVMQMLYKTRRGSPVDCRPPLAKAPIIAKLHTFSKMAVTFEPLMGF